MSDVDEAEIWAERVAVLEAKIEVGQPRLERTVSQASGLIAGGADDDKIQRARADAQAAEVDLEYLRKGLETAQRELSDAKAAAAVDVIKAKGDRVGRLQKRRAKVLRDADASFSEFLKHPQHAETLAQDIHQAGSGCRTLGLAVNERHGPVVTWLTVRLLEGFPAAAALMGQVIPNHMQGRQEMEGKALADLQPDYAEMFKDFHAEEDIAA
jgi:hypothetical protein